MLFAAAVAAANSTDHETSRTGGRAVHGIVPPAFEFRWAQYRVGLPREWRDGEVRHSHQTGRRDARRWPRSIEDDKSLTPSQGGEPERRRDERRTRRQAGASGNRAQGQCRRTRFSPSAREKGSENAPLAAAAAATATATGAAAASIGLREASRFEQGISPLASSVEMTWVEGRRTRDGHGHGHRKRSTATDEAVPPYLASMSPRASLRVEGSPPSLEWWSLERSSIRRRDLVSAPLAARSDSDSDSDSGSDSGSGSVHRIERGISLRAGDLSTRKLGRDDMGGGPPDPG
jgi:hypothetical protein